MGAGVSKSTGAASAERPGVVLAFSDHYKIDEQSRIDPAATEANTRRWRRDVLSPGLHRPFWRCLVEMSIPVAQASAVLLNGKFARC